MLVILRHGETIYNTLGLYQGLLDSELTRKGIQEVSTIAKKLNNLYDLNKFDIYTSPSLRCISTLKIIQDITLTSLKIQKSGLLSEQRYGLWEGEESARIKEKFKGIPLEDFNFYTPPLGESFEQAKLRAREWLHFNFLKEPEKDYLIVTHKKISMAIRQILIPNRSHLDHPQNTFYELDIIQPHFFEYTI